MKKNLRIVSAAAAALLAVAPIATTVVSNNASVVSAATTGNIIDVSGAQSVTGSQKVAGLNELALNFDINAVANTAKSGQTPNGSLNADLKTMIGDKNITTVVGADANSNAKIDWTEGDTTHYENLTKANAISLKENTPYHISVENVAYNLDTSYADKDVTLFAGNGAKFVYGGTTSNTITVKANDVGVVRLGSAQIRVGTNANGTGIYQSNNVRVRSGAFLAINPKLKGSLAFYNVANGNRVDGNAPLAMNTKEGKTSVRALINKFEKEYKLSWTHNANFSGSVNSNVANKLNSKNWENEQDIASQLRAQGITVNTDGTFNVPEKGVTLYWTAEGANGAQAKMTTNVTFDNKNAVSGLPRITVKAGDDNGKVFTGENNKVATPSEVAKLELNGDLANYAAKVKNLFSATVSNDNQSGLDVSVDTSKVDAATAGVYPVYVTAKNDKGTSSVYFDVTVGNPTDAKPAKKTGEVKVMHNSYIYDKDYKRVGTGKIATYSEISVYGTETINGKKFYRISATKAEYIDAENVDGVKRTLKHNAYVYATSKRRANKTVMKKGTEVVTYGSAVKFSNGKYYYRIQGCTAAHKMYIKKANF